MSQTRTDRRPQVAASTIKMKGAKRDAPLSPHLFIWKWTPTNLTSIFHRATGVTNAIGAALLTAWLAAGAIGEGAYNGVKAVLGSPIGLLVMFVFSLSVMYHLCNGVRHLIWDSGHMLRREQRVASAFAIYAAATVLTVAIWVVAFTAQGS